MNPPICTFCGQNGHVASSCTRRGESVSQKRLIAESEFRAIRQPRMDIVRRKARKLDPAKLAEWKADLERINKDLER